MLKGECIGADELLVTMTAPADWYPDPSGRHHYRYWDGARWTPHVATDGNASIDYEDMRPLPADEVAVLEMAMAASAPMQRITVSIADTESDTGPVWSAASSFDPQPAPQPVPEIEEPASGSDNSRRWPLLRRNSK